MVYLRPYYMKYLYRVSGCVLYMITALFFAFISYGSVNGGDPIFAISGIAITVGLIDVSGSLIRRGT